MNNRKWVLTLVIVVILVIAIAGAAAYFSGANNSPNPSPTLTPTASSKSPAPSSASPSNTPTNTITQIPSATAPTTPTPTPSSQTTASPIPTNSPSATPTSTPTLTSTPTPTSTNQPPTTATFNFDSGNPAPYLREPTPFDVTNNGVTVHVSSPMDIPPTYAFSVQSRDSLASISVILNSSLFLGNFLWPNTIYHYNLTLSFSRNITNISLAFATCETHDPGPGGTGSTMRLSAYLNSHANLVGTPATKNGVEPPADVYPEGTLTFNSGGQPFNFVEIDLPSPLQGATGFLIDNIIVSTT